MTKHAQYVKWNNYIAELFVGKFEFRSSNPRSNKNMIQKYSKFTTKISNFDRLFPRFSKLNQFYSSEVELRPIRGKIFITDLYSSCNVLLNDLHEELLPFNKKKLWNLSSEIWGYKLRFTLKIIPNDWNWPLKTLNLIFLIAFSGQVFCSNYFRTHCKAAAEGGNSNIFIDLYSIDIATSRRLAWKELRILKVNTSIIFPS